MNTLKKSGFSSQSKALDDWERISEKSAIKQLTGELRRQVAQPEDQARWSLTGHAIIIEHHDCDEVQQLMPRFAESAGMAFHFITRQNVICNSSEWLPKTLIDEPSLFFLEPGFWIGNHSIDDDLKTDIIGDSEGTEQDGITFRLKLAEYLVNDICKHPVVIVTTLRELKSMDISMRRCGLFDRRIKLPVTTPTECAESFLSLAGKSNCDATLLNHKHRLGVILQDSFEDKRRRDLVAQTLQRLAWRESRLINVADLIRCIIYGTTEEDPVPQDAMQIRRHAIHEAGHTLINVKNSDGEHIPEYCSVQTLGDSHGVVMPSVTYIVKMNDDPGLAEMLHSIRVSLAGRAAEHAVLGPIKISVKGSRSDLVHATRLAYSMFSRWGISPFLEIDDKVGSNLAVTNADQEIGSCKKTDEIVQKFLDNQYQVVLSQIKDNRQLLDELTCRLISQTILIKEDIEQIFSEYLNALPTA